ncbi:SWPV1-028 [Shearwaterpox virus]|uniref:SWPV1-028 n=1 Tax=Shearwaterpox virus TaxID=1974596 RepID=A0A1V0S7N6_CNPV|nr:SWPV1-028 [Shearwaterpox virus]
MDLICYKNNLPRIRTFTKDHFRNFKDIMIKEIETNYMDLDSSEGEKLDTENCKAKKIVYRSLCKEVTSKLEILIYSVLRSIATTVYVDDEVSVITYEEGDYLSKNKSSEQDICKNTLCMCMLLSLQDAEEGGEFRMYTDEGNCLIISSDVLFDKFILHECTRVIDGKKCIAIFDIIVKLKNEEGNLNAVTYMDNDLHLYSDKENKTFCYCEIEFIKSSLHSEHFFVGVIINKNGKCILIHTNFEISSCDTIIFNSFKELSLYIFNDECDEVNVDHIDDTIWSSYDDSDLLLPNDKKLFKALMETDKKENTSYCEIELSQSYEEYTDKLTLHCIIGTYYFNLPNRKTIIDYMINNFIDNNNVADWKELSDTHKRYILSWTPYKELFYMAISPCENDEFNSNTEESDSSESEN